MAGGPFGGGILTVSSGLPLWLPPPQGEGAGNTNTTTNLLSVRPLRLDVLAAVDGGHGLELLRGMIGAEPPITRVGEDHRRPRVVGAGDARARGVVDGPAHRLGVEVAGLGP